MQYTLQNLLLSWHVNAVLAPVATVIILLLVLFMLSVSLRGVAALLNKRYITPVVSRYLPKNTAIAFTDKAFVKCVFRLIPGFFFLGGASLLILEKAPWTQQLSRIVIILSLFYLLYNAIKAIYACFDIITVWAKYNAKGHHQPIKGYIQIAKIMLAALSVIFAISIIIDKSPWMLLTGLGALSAVLLLVFKDTIMGLVANIQVSAYDMVRVGDWITIPQYYVDGDVLDISVNTVKVQNFDRTILTVPTSALIQSGVQNWRGMSESGGRRIKRAVHIDIATIRFCDDALLVQLRQIDLLRPIIEERTIDIKHDNKEKNINGENRVNGRNMTNIGLFRYYTEAYLKSLSTVNFSLTFLVRQLAPTETGLPLQLYIFTNDTNWIRYEAIQADIFDHLLAALPTFGLSVFQVENAS